MPGQSPWTEEPSGLQSMGSEKSHAAKHSTAQDTRVINKDRDIKNKGNENKVINSMNSTFIHENKYSCILLCTKCENVGYSVVCNTL